MSRLLSASLLLLLAAGCDRDHGSDGGSGPDLPYSVADCGSVVEQNAFVHQLMHDLYLWRDSVPQLDYASYDSPEALLEAMRYADKDRWSYIDAADADSAYYRDGTYLGLGYQLVNQGGFLLFAYVYPRSPVAAAGIARGDRLRAINGIDVEALTTPESWAAAVGEVVEGSAVELEVEDADGVIASHTVLMDWVPIDPVFEVATHQSGSATVGYLGFKSFVETAYAELDAAFSDFSAAGATELIVDLRYNGGGLVDVARRLGAQLGGVRTADRVFTSYRHNTLHAALDKDLYFEDRAGGFQRVVLLTGPATCSASELVANSLAPHVEVVRVGGTTCGKPVGMYGVGFCDKVIRPVSFEVVNEAGEGGYYTGLAPDCFASDDLDHPLGDPAEATLAAALGYLESGTCPAAPAAKPSRRTVPLPEGRDGIGVF